MCLPSGARKSANSGLSRKWPFLSKVVVVLTFDRSVLLVIECHKVKLSYSIICQYRNSLTSPQSTAWGDELDIFYVLSFYFVVSRSQRVSLIIIPFRLSVWISVGHSATYSLPRLIDHNQIWSAGIFCAPAAFLGCGSRFSCSLSGIEPWFLVTRYNHGRHIAYHWKLIGHTLERYVAGSSPCNPLKVIQSHQTYEPGGPIGFDLPV